MNRMISRWYHNFRQYGTTPVERYYVAAHFSGNLASGTLSDNTLYAVPLVMPYRSRLDRVGIRVLAGSGVGVAVRIGVYDFISSTDLTPSFLVLDSGEMAVTANGFITKAVNWVLEGNTLYWMAVLSNTSLTIRTIPVTGTYPILGYDNSLEAGSSAAGMGWVESATYGPFPPTFSSPTVYPSLSGIPAIAYRLSESGSAP